MLKILDHTAERDTDIAGRPYKLKAEDFALLGLDVRVWPLAKIINTLNVSLNHRVIIDDFTFISAFGEPVSIGKFVHIASFCSVTGTGGFIMEDFAGFAAGVRVSTSDEDYSGGSSLTNPTIPPEFRNVRSKLVTIQKHAIIGTNTVILPGVTVGEGCAVGANSVITKDLEPWTICVGTPAKPIKARPKADILRLEQELFAKYPQYK